MNSLQMPTPTRSLPKGLATVAFLKARLDSGVDHIEMFMPLINDTIQHLPSTSFTCAEVQELLSRRHGVAMPQHTLTTLLNRAARSKIVKREFSRYLRLKTTKVVEDIQVKRTIIEAEQRHLSDEFRKHAEARGHQIDDDEEALRLILGFLEDNHVAILLGVDDRPHSGTTLTPKESRLVAGFVQGVMSVKSDLSVTLQNILEGLVVYNAAFLKDITSASRQFQGLRVFFDTRILLQLLGYEGDAAATLARETLQLLRSAGVQCLAFDKTIYECRGVLKVFESKLGTTQGTKELRPTPMTRYFLTERYTPADLRQMIALLPQELAALGIQTSPMPKHVTRFTMDEEKLAQALADEVTHDSAAPRVVHDVDCVAGILTLRRGERSTSLSQVKAIFVTSTGKVVGNVQKWYEEEGETGIGPAVHIRALSNLVWLRRPALAVNLKAHELVALSTAALQPSRKTWDRFIEHLNRLEKSRRITSEETVAIVVSEMTEELLANVDDASIDDDDVVDATTLDEVIDRVRSTYEASARQLVEEREAEANARIEEARAHASELEAQATAHAAQADRRQQAAAENYRRLKLAVEGKALGLARGISLATSLLVAVPVIVGAIVLLIEHPFHTGLIGRLIGFGLVAFVFMEFLGIMSHITHLRSRLEILLLPLLRRALGAEAPRPLSSSSFLGLSSATEDEASEDVNQ